MPYLLWGTAIVEFCESKARWRIKHETQNVTLRKLGKKGQFLCDLVEKSEGGPCFFFREGGSSSKGGHVASFERGGRLAWGVHWHWGGGGRYQSNTVPTPRCGLYLPLPHVHPPPPGTTVPPQPGGNRCQVTPPPPPPGGGIDTIANEQITAAYYTEFMTDLLLAVRRPRL